MSDINRLIALQKIVETRSFSRAAELTGYTQSAISQMISALEADLGIQLLNRSRNGVELTIEGKDLYPYLEGILLQYHAAMEKAGEINQLETGHVRLGTFSSISQYWLPSAIREFQSSYPKVDFIVREGDYTTIPQWIKTGEIDFGIISSKADTSLNSVPLHNGSMVAILPSDHPLTKMKAVPLEALAKENFILLEEGAYSETLEAFRSIGRKPVIRYTMHDDYTIMTMVEAGLGVSILAELILTRTDYDIAIRPVDPPIIRKMSIVYKNEANLPIASKRFIEILQKNADQLP